MYGHSNCDRPDLQNGVPFGPPNLSYPQTEIDADYTVGTPIHPAYMGDSSILKLFPRLDLPKLNLGRCRKFMSNFGTFWGPLPHVGAASPKTGLHYQAHTRP
jgi:hypothetical protein